MANTPRVTPASVEDAGAPTRSRRSGSTSEKAPHKSNRLAPGVVGARLRSRRLEMGISLRQFARDVDVSASFISQLETGKAQPSVATFYSICTALRLTIDELFADDDAATPASAHDQPDHDERLGQWSSLNDALPALCKGTTTVAGTGPQVVRPDERKALVLDSGVTWEALIGAPGDKTDFMFVRYDVGGSSTVEGRFMRHVGTEYGYVMKGTLEIVVGFETLIMQHF